MKISIAMCTYNGELYLEEQLDSIRRQSYLPDELIVCDDASQDRTFAILEKFREKVDFTVILYRNEKNIGSTANFAEAIQCCSGDIIFLADQDDYWLPQKIERIVKKFRENPELGMIFTDAFVTDEKLNSYPRGLWECVGFNLYYQKLLQREPWMVFSKKSVVTGTTMAFRARWKDILIPFPAFWTHDEWIAFVFSLVCFIDFLSERLIQYRLHQNQQIGVNPRQHHAITHWRTKIFPMQHRRNCDRLIKRMEAAMPYIIKLQNYLHDPVILSDLQEQLAHWNARFFLPNNFIKKVKIIRRELSLGRYQKYSGSKWMAFKDFVEK